MKILLFLLLAGVPALAADDGIPKHPRDLKYPALDYQPPQASGYRHKLASGATAYMVEDHELPLVNIFVLVRTGKYLEPEGKVGLTSLVGSQMRSGGTKTKPPAAFDEDAAYLAAQMSSMVGDTMGEARMNCLTRTLDSCMALFFDMLQNPGFADDRLKLAKTQALQGMQRRNDATMEIERREFARLLRGPNFFTVKPITKASLESITREDLAAFHSRYYYPSNFIFAVSGDFHTKEMMAKLDKATAGWQNGTEKVPDVPKPGFALKPGIYIVDKKDVNQGRVSMGHLGTTFDNPDHLALEVMNGILGGGGFTSRIMSRVRSDEGLAYSAGSQFSIGRYYDGVFMAGFQSKSPTVAQAVSIVREEIDRIRTDKVKPDELSTEINSSVEALSRRFATAGQKAMQFASDDYNKMPADYWRTYRDRIKALTADDILRVAKKYLQPDKLVTVVVGDANTILKGNPDKPQYQLSKFGNIERIPLPDPLTMEYPKAQAAE
jgi:zinc protease